MRSILALFAMIFSGTAALAADYKIDPAHTHIEFRVPHVVVSKVEGRFNKFEGTFSFDEKSQKLDKVNVIIKTDSIDTNQPDRDKHLRSADFFDVAKHPDITFKGTKTIYDGPKPEKIEGDLTIHGVTKKVTMEIDYKGAVTDHMGTRRIAFECELEINRKDFGMTWNKSLDKGGVAVGDEVKIEILGEAVLAQAAKK